MLVLRQTWGSGTDQQMWQGQEPGIPQKASLPREARSDSREGNELGWQGARRWYKEAGGAMGEWLGQLNPNTLDSDSPHLGNSTDYLGVLLSCAQILS